MTRLQKPTDYFTREEIARLRTRSPWRAWAMIVHCWGVIIGTWVVCTIWPHPLLIAAGVLIIGARQLGLFVISHDGAHHTLFGDRALNDWVCEWLLNRPLLGASIVSYRAYHLEHHKHTQQPEDPDLHLSAPFPITRESFRRKMVRDLTGQTGWKQRKAVLSSAFGPSELGWRARVKRFSQRLGPNVTINAIILAAFASTGVWYLYFLLWVLPNMTWLLFITRIRNIGEHAAVLDDDDRLRNTRTTHANWLERALVAPYFVNYHLEHHLLVSCPCYRLPEAHALLLSKGHGPYMELQPSYPAMLRTATLAG